MGDSYLGEIRMFAGNFAPAGWAFCNGQLLPISEYDTLYVLLGTQYGGDGQETFALPNLQSRFPMHVGNNHVLSEMSGVESVTLTTQQIPVHTHGFLASKDPASARGAAGLVLGRGAADSYASEFTPDLLSPQSISPVGGSQPHDNMHPYLCINFIICLYGIFPTQT